MAISCRVDFFCNQQIMNLFFFEDIRIYFGWLAKFNSSIKSPLQFLPLAKKAMIYINLDQFYGHPAINNFIPIYTSISSPTSRFSPLGRLAQPCSVHLYFYKTKKPSQQEIQSDADAALNSGLLSKLTLCAIQKADYETPKKERTIENASGVPVHPSERKEPVARTQ